MTDLDSFAEINQIDSQGFLNRIVGFPKQLEEALNLQPSFNINPFPGSHISSVVISGVGGSAIGAEFVRSRLMDISKLPLSVIRHYRLPEYVNQNTLVIASSYSGNTEETISAVEEGLKKKAQIVVVTSGGKLQEMAKARGLNCFIIPSGYPPRMAIGFSIVAVFSILESLQVAPSMKNEIEESSHLLENLAREEYGVHIPESQNLAKQLARLLYGKFPVIYASSDYMDAVALRWREQIEENAKTLAGHFLLPEMTHNEIVGWHEPKDLLNRFVTIFLIDSEDHRQIKYRFDYSEKVIRKTGAEIVRLETRGKYPLARMFSLAYLSDFTSFYLALLNGIDPTPIEVIDRLKRELVQK